MGQSMPEVQSLRYAAQKQIQSILEQLENDTGLTVEQLTIAGNSCHHGGEFVNLRSVVITITKSAPHVWRGDDGYITGQPHGY